MPLSRFILRRLFLMFFMLLAVVALTFLLSARHPGRSSPIARGDGRHRR